MDKMTYDEWVSYGMHNDFVGPAVCLTHDGLPTTDDEDKAFEEDDICIHVLRLYGDKKIRLLVEENHSPSIWRK
jgi:hypothetical protein